MTQMDEPMKSGGRLEVSVSFGRFENDALSWEKWSTFSPNKYLEEAGNLSTPGSVAQKKAYFEAHYKKIAARKAELEQEKMMVPIIRCPVVPSKEDCDTESSDIDSKSSLSNEKRSVEDVGEVSCTPPLENGPVFYGIEDDDSESPKGDVQAHQGACINGSVARIALEEDNANTAVKCESPVIEEAKNELNGNAEESQLCVREDDALVVSLSPQKDSSTTTGKPSARKSGKEQVSALKKGNSMLIARNSAQKVTPTKKERTLPWTRSKVNTPASAPPLAKPLRASTTRNLKPMNAPASSPKILKKQLNGSPLLKSNKSLVGQSKRAAPSSLHMSLSLSSGNSFAAVSMTRKSLIMEKMGDKDIVKRAFKTFQNRTNGSAIGEKPSPINQMSPTTFQPKVAASCNPTKGNEGSRKDSVNQATQRSQSGTRSNPPLKGLHKSSAMERKNPLSFSPTTGLRNGEKAEKRKEFLKKLEAKSIAREADRVAQLPVQSKVRVGSEIHHQGPTLSR